MKNRSIGYLAAFGFLLLQTALYAQQADSAPLKFALIIGNGNYTSITKLSNPVNDANDMADVLTGLGFTVDKVLNGNLDQMENAVTLFKNRLGVSKNSYGFLFYAGHGVQSGGENYLIPVDANIQSENYLRQRAISVQTVLDEINSSGNELNIIVLDACRDNPFSWRRSGSRGLSIVSYQPADSIIVYATSAGSTAADGEGRNGLFTGYLLDNLRNPNLEVTEIFRLTMGDVARASNNQQRPAIYNQFPGTAYLGARPGNAPSDAALAAQPASVTPSTMPQTGAGQARPAAPRQEKPRPPESTRLWTVGASAGSAFSAPMLTATVRGTLAPLSYSFIELGMDFGLFSSFENSGYYSLYPFVHAAFYMPVSTIGGWYAGAGGGYMMAQYTFTEGQGYPEGDKSVNIFAGDLVAGFNLFDMIDISYTFRSNFKSVSNKLSVGYIWRFNRGK